MNRCDTWKANKKMVDLSSTMLIITRSVKVLSTSVTTRRLRSAATGNRTCNNSMDTILALRGHMFLYVQELLNSCRRPYGPNIMPFS